ncbi:MAG: hypothetical protein IT452_08720 [Planctomycetia bacterium]|nr:hypothetical protein [Planctomycetia bacterium]
MEHVFIDDQVVILSDETGERGRVAWADLAEVAIVTTGAGPAVEDFYWVLGAADGKKLTVPSEAGGADRLLERLQKLAGFDNAAVIEASACTEDRVFECWRKGG